MKYPPIENGAEFFTPTKDHVAQQFPHVAPAHSTSMQNTQTNHSRITIAILLSLITGCSQDTITPSRSQKTSDATPLTKEIGSISMPPSLIKSGFMILAVNPREPQATALVDLNMTYRDSSQNGKADRGDAGFFNPASTIKVSLAGLVLEQLATDRISLRAQYRPQGSNQWHSIREDIKSMLVISDNEATNRLIHLLGFTRIQHRLAELGLRHTSINRLMLDQGTLTASPGHEVKDADGQTTNTQPSPAPASPRWSCMETDSKVGNCSTGSDLVVSLRHLLDSAPGDPGFRIRSEDRAWVNQIMALTPRQNGYVHPDDYCRFIAPAASRKSLEIVSVQSKCGVALFSNTYVDLSRIRFRSGRLIDLVLAKSYTHRVSDAEVVSDFSRAATDLVLALPSTVR